MPLEKGANIVQVYGRTSRIEHHSRCRCVVFGCFPAIDSSICVPAGTLTANEKVPAAARPPTIDGVMEPGEWDRAAACTGFVTAFQGKLAKTQSTAWVTYDSHYLYVAFRNFRGAELKFISAKARRNDDDAIVYDPANEIWFSPPGSPRTTFQTIVNVYPAVFDSKMIPSVGYTSKSWSGRWEVASRLSTDSWTVEARTPISRLWHGQYC